MTRYVGSKWRKTVAIRKHAYVVDYVPETGRMTRTALLNYLNRFGMVYIKPEFGSFGKGVMRVEKTKAGYRFQNKKMIYTFTAFPLLYHSILRHTGGKRYLVQKGIRLLEYGGRKFDMRVMVQYSPNRKWEATGIIGRVAAKGKIVTNYHSGGQIVSADRLLRGHTQQVKTKLNSLSKLGVQTGKAMRNAFPGVKVIGLDIAMDKTLHPWILEVNTSPDPYIFRKHSNPNVFKKIMQYAKSSSKK